MSDKKDFTYDGHVTLNLSPITIPVQEISITSIEHMIPMNVKCTLDGTENVLTAYIDYKTNRIHLPKDTTSELRGSDELFRNLILDYFKGQSEEATRRYEEEFPPREASEFQDVPIPPDYKDKVKS